ncbi:hypothetical protein SCP_0602620 [Sparassis crispa]|uniref:Uncharacterized protein n=1 Tax=Sparassis crispa TaxID=139825 RepID=A0A401GRD8_9APHY|nr:hypothetical protein SCP_0602620 [Sparassis crispa]GBE84284.1 hypothetical protein SCP_0602620 [Sparassis crispa]
MTATYVNTLGFCMAQIGDSQFSLATTCPSPWVIDEPQVPCAVLSDILDWPTDFTECQQLRAASYLLLLRVSRGMSRMSVSYLLIKYCQDPAPSGGNYVLATNKTAQ